MDAHDNIRSTQKANASTLHTIIHYKGWKIKTCVQYQRLGYINKRIEMSKNTSVTLGEHFEEIIEKSIKSGRYSSASEVIREGLRLVEEREKKITLLREAIEAGEKSGFIKNFDPIKHLANLNEDYAK